MSHSTSLSRAGTPSVTARGVTLVLIGLVSLALFWLCFRIHLAGQPLFAVAALVLGLSAIYVYASARTLAWRYLFPGVVGMLLFVAFPLLYTMQIGFTNYSSNNLLSLERARAYLLDQREEDAARAMGFTLHAEGANALRIVLTIADAGEATTSATTPSANGIAPIRYVSPVVRFGDAGERGDTGVSNAAAPGSVKGPLRMQALAEQGGGLGPAMGLADIVRHRDLLMSLQLALPATSAVDQPGVLSYAGLREFAPLQPVWRAEPDGSLTLIASQLRYRPNMDTGFFEGPQGNRMQPGFKVGIGFANYSRMLFDADMRGPFVSIFIWTVVFAGLTVLFSTALGITLAVVLNWEALKYRTLYRTLLFLPYAVPGFISILVFKGLFNQNFGEINAILNALFGIRPAWFADPTLAKSMILIVNTWLGYPYIMVLCTGLIKAIPSDLYEASAIAGAKPLTNFFKITLPLIARPLTPLLISAFAFNFNNFVLISLLTDGRPDYLNTKLPAGTTDIMVSYTYRIAFTDAGTNFGLAAAISTLIFIVVALMSLANLRLTRSNEERRS